MKRILIFVIIILSSTIASAQEGRKIYNKYSNNKGVSAVYISPAMFNIIGKLPDLQIENGGEESLDLGPLISSFSGFYMLEVSDPTLIGSLSQEVNSMIEKGRYELIMEVIEEGDKLRMYTAGNARIIESFVFYSVEGESIHFICIDGQMNRDDVEKLIVTAAQ